MFFAYCISCFINNSFETGHFPSLLKRSKIVPVFKSGSTHDIQNYRPIAINNLLSKVFEKTAFDQINNYVYNNNLLYELQFGFSTNKNTEMAFIYLISRIIELRHKYKVAVLFLDFSKAFDSINHEHIISKLYNHFGIKNTALHWLKSYLNNRTQFVSIDNFTSQDRAVKYGVPQGSILGPLLFKLFINDLHNSLNSDTETIFYADDTALIIHAEDWKSIERKCNNELINIDTYCRRNQLFLNTRKSAVVYFNKHDSINLSVSLHNNNIPIVNEFKYLGFYIESGLKFKRVPENIIKKLSFFNLSLSRASRFVDHNSLILLYNAFHLSFIVYYKIIFYVMNKKNLNTIPSKLIGAGTIVLNCSRRNVTALNWQLSYLVNLYNYLGIFKILKCSENPLNKLLPPTNHNYNTRNRRFHIISQTNRSDLIAYQILIPKLLMKLPLDLQNENRFSKFKKHLKII